MRVLVTGNCTPFFNGGAQHHLSGLKKALQEAGHEVDSLLLPFTFFPESSVIDLMEYITHLDWEKPNGKIIDRIISLQFPGYGIKHPNHVAWVMHQHRAVYDLYDEQTATQELRNLKRQIEQFDRLALSSANRLFANSINVANRLKKFLQLESTPLYHPPPNSELFYTAQAQSYVFFPSRLEVLKRQSLLCNAASLMKSNLKIIFSGSGGNVDSLENEIKRLGLQSRIRYIGFLNPAEKLAFYANSSAIIYPVFDEDYGYVTLESMLSSKPVLTCSDSGGPLEWITHGLNGWICEPDPKALADQLDWIADHPKQVAVMGQIAREIYQEKAPNWNNVVKNLLSK